MLCGGNLEIQNEFICCRNEKLNTAVIWRENVSNRINKSFIYVEKKNCGKYFHSTSNNNIWLWLQWLEWFQQTESLACSDDVRILYNATDFPSFSFNVARKPWWRRKKSTKSMMEFTSMKIHPNLSPFLLSHPVRIICQKSLKEKESWEPKNTKFLLHWKPIIRT